MLLLHLMHSLARSLIIILAIHGGLDGESHEMSLIGARIT